CAPRMAPAKSSPAPSRRRWARRSRSRGCRRANCRPGGAWPSAAPTCRCARWSSPSSAPASPPGPRPGGDRLQSPPPGLWIHWRHPSPPTRDPETGMSEIPGDLRFMKSHEWARIEGDGKVTIGISDHAQGLLGDLVYVELPAVGDSVDAGNACAVVESVKARSEERR